MSAEIIATLVMGAALAVLIVTQNRGLRGEFAGIRAEITQLCERMAYIDGLVSGLALASIAAARENQEK